MASNHGYASWNLVWSPGLGLGYFRTPSSHRLSPETIHFTLIRLFLLSVIAGLATFTIRMLRACLHIAEENRHRVRVANSMESFLQSTVEPEQRGLILAKLADSIVNFGDSGLVREREDHLSTMSGDLIGRIVSAM